MQVRVYLTLVLAQLALQFLEGLNYRALETLFMRLLEDVASRQTEFDSAAPGACHGIICPS
jgi:hypothetical protein